MMRLDILYSDRMERLVDRTTLMRTKTPSLLVVSVPIAGAYISRKGPCWVTDNAIACSTPKKRLVLVLRVVFTGIE